MLTGLLVALGAATGCAVDRPCDGTPDVAGATLFVADRRGEDSAEGSAQQPLQAALARAVPGDVIAISGPAASRTRPRAPACTWPAPRC